jgi:hypothetical protein
MAYTCLASSAWGILPYQPQSAEGPSCELRKLRRHGAKYCVAGHCPLCAKGLCRQANCGYKAKLAPNRR